MKNMRAFTVRRFQAEDAEEVAALIQKTLQISNAKDYSKESIEALVKTHTPEHPLQRVNFIGRWDMILKMVLLW